MNLVCSHCGLASPDGNLFCPRAECSVRNLVAVFRKGDFFGEFEILNLLQVMRTATVYEAKRRGKAVLLKIAHYDDPFGRLMDEDYGYSGYLIQEAAHLKAIERKKIVHPAMPKLMSPYAKLSPGQEPYGKVMVQGQLRYYLVFDHIKGQFLADYLNDHPQPPHHQAGWLVQTLAQLLLIFHNELQTPHLAITPENVLVRSDADHILRPTLMDFGFTLLQKSPNVSDQSYQLWLSRYLHPAYTASEVLTQLFRVGERTDVYHLGLILYEVLAGRPVYEHISQTDESIRVAIQDENPPSLLGRIDLAEDLNYLVDSMVSKDPTFRPDSMAVLIDKLKTFFGRVPHERKEGGWRRLLPSR
jgi:serine/threonine protein kinase